MALHIGSQAPLFTLKTLADGALKSVNLADHFGKESVLLLFFPGAFTGVCTEEFCDVSNGLNAYKTLNAQVYGISVDSPFALDAWAKAHNIQVPLLSDYTHAVTQAYDVVLPDLAGLGPSSARAAVVIGKDGLVKYFEVTPTPKDLPDFTAIKAALA